jgi:hypothetical protein
MTRARSTELLRVTAFVALGSLVLHQARYLAGHGSGAGEALAHDGHAHMGLALLVTLSLGMLLSIISLTLAALARPRNATAGTSRPGIGPVGCALAVLAAFCAQELAEGALIGDHPAGIQAILGHGGVIVFPLAALLGVAISLLIEGLGVAELRVAGCLTSRRLRDLTSPGRTYPEPDVDPLAVCALVFGFACRPPPLLNTPC